MKIKEFKELEIEEIGLGIIIGGVFGFILGMSIKLLVVCS